MSQSHEELILKTLFEIKASQGNSEAQLADLKSRMTNQDVRIDGIAKTVSKLWDFQTTAKAKVSVIAVVATAITSALLWLAKRFLSVH